LRRVVTAVAVAILLAGPTALAFFSGGYFDEPRLVAAIGAWILVGVAALTSPSPLPQSRPGRLAVGGLVLLCAWTGLSLIWAPLQSRATDDFVRLLLYVAALVAAAGLLRGERLLRLVEPALALGSVVVIGYGLAGRLVPGVLELHASARADGRLEQPLTYWNAEGALAAMGLVLCARLAGDASRPSALRALAAASSALLGAGLYLSLSRGAIVGAVVGLCVLLAAAPTRTQLRAAALVLAAATLAGAWSAAFPGVASLEGSLGARETDGAIVLALLAATALAAALAAVWVAGAELGGRLRTGRLPFARRLPAFAAAAVALALVGLAIGGLGGRGEARTSEGRAGHLVSLKSRRYDYWKTSLNAFADRPLKGIGTGGFSVVWLQERPVADGALDAHSLPLETAAELGLVGLLALSVFIAGVGIAAHRALRRQELLAGGAAAASAWLLQATIDWHWEMPAVTLPALVIAGALIAASERPGDEASREAS
jgi:O-antigen ligase